MAADADVKNTVDCLKYTRELKALNIAVFFEKENINTLDVKGRGTDDNHGGAGPARIGILVGKRPPRHPVPKPARQGAGQP